MGKKSGKKSTRKNIVRGSRTQVLNGNADRTTGGLTAKDFLRLPDGRIVSKARRLAGLRLYRSNKKVRSALLEGRKRLGTEKTSNKKKSTKKKSTKKKSTKKKSTKKKSTKKKSTKKTSKKKTNKKKSTKKTKKKKTN